MNNNGKNNNGKKLQQFFEQGKKVKRDHPEWELEKQTEGLDLEAVRKKEKAAKKDEE